MVCQISGGFFSFFPVTEIFYNRIKDETKLRFQTKFCTL